MNVTLENAGKRFGTEWIFRRINLDIKKGNRIAILGSNGSGKSTLAQVIAGYLSLNEGKLHTDPFEESAYPLHISFTAPYLELPEEYTIDELADFHFSLRTILPGVKIKDLKSLVQLDQSGHKIIKTFSSGMKQRMKLGLALLTNSEMVIVDEPFTNLDANGKRWYAEMMETYLGERTLVVCSNHQTEEYSLCKEHLEMNTWKEVK